MTQSLLDFRIRAACPDDAEAIREIYAHYVEHTPVSLELEAPSVSAIRSRMAGVQSEFPWLVLESDGLLRGYAYGSKFHPRNGYRFTAEVSVYLHPDFRGKGAGSLLYEELFHRLQLQGLHNLIAVVTLPNQASAKLHEKFGFVQAANFLKVGYKFGRWWDVGYWQKRLDQQEEPKSLS